MVTEISSGQPLGGDVTKPGPVFMNVLRLIFVLVLWGVGWSMAADERLVGGELRGHGDLFVIGCIGVALIVIALDLFLPRKSLGAKRDRLKLAVCGIYLLAVGSKMPRMATYLRTGLEIGIAPVTKLILYSTWKGR